MGRRNIRLRPVRRKEIDLRRLAVAVTLLAAHQQRQGDELPEPEADATKDSAKATGGGS